MISVAKRVRVGTGVQRHPVAACGGYPALVTVLRWRPAEPTDVDDLTDLFAACEKTDPVGLDVESDQVRARLAVPGLDLTRDTLVAEDAGRVVAYGETADMGTGPGVLRTEVRDGEAVAVTDYWAEPFTAPEWRRALGERLDMPAGGLWPTSDVRRPTSSP